MSRASFLGVFLGLSLIIPAQFASAEPYLAVQKGMQCSNCHSHPAGGGKRTVDGNVFTQTELAGRKIGQSELWTGELTKWLAVGGDLRACYERFDTPNQSTTDDCDIGRGTFYL